ncbi:protein of unknown function (DUF4485) [Carpediemonas membranifera]|uniref:DUF4485 domain-containing protein n=1 Tax=Carpediemonas membranifera TaxID=201153 RepID=A0A8J6E470_9EUKA|nr:protein of unknown function (DUF4485) [Carpediemonas membranifera]|eukprot:KAG9396521.1 protein of unknown function (DUF4485) [Carpediemonas membranifera]
MELSATLDKRFQDCILSIDREYVYFNTHDRILIEKWVQRLSEPHTLISWKKNRNLYARLLRQFVHDRSLQEPFRRLPPDGDLPNLPSYMHMYLKKEKGAVKRPSTSASQASFIGSKYDPAKSRMEDSIHSLRERNTQIMAENRTLNDENDRLRADNQRLERELSQARRVIAEQRATIKQQQAASAVSASIHESQAYSRSHGGSHVSGASPSAVKLTNSTSSHNHSGFSPARPAMARMEDVRDVIKDGYQDSDDDPDFLEELREYHRETMRLKDML